MSELTTEFDAANLKCLPAPRYVSQANKAEQAFRIGIVGCGPKGFFCLESLLRHLGTVETITPPVEIVIFETADFPGAGNIYDPQQSDHLRMNYASGKIDAWFREPEDISPTSKPLKTIRSTDHGLIRLSLVQWLERNSPHLACPHGYVPRSLVGKYLSECFFQTIKDSPKDVETFVVNEMVAEINYRNDHWSLSTDTNNIASDNTDDLLFDEVLITTGHGGWREDSVFPVEQQLAPSRVPTGSTVAVRGFALTFIDAALSLTEGRGGKFKELGGNGGVHYTKCSDEPEGIFPYSRSGRPMLAKPDGDRIMLPPNLNGVWLRGTELLRNTKCAGQPMSFSDSVWPVVVSTAAKAFSIVSGTMSVDRSAKRIHDWLTGWFRQPASPTDILKRMKHSLEGARGRAALDEAWAIGETWRQLYPALVEVVSHDGLSVSQESNFSDYENALSNSSFATIATEMERIAFGPPAVNLEKLVGLIEAGIVDLTHIKNANTECDVHLNATVPSFSEFQLGPLRALIETGIVQHSANCGVIVDQSGRPLDASGHGIDGLAVVGRATEGCVLGNDTLSRKLHQHPECWAESVCVRIGGRSAV